MTSSRQTPEPETPKQKAARERESKLRQRRRKEAAAASRESRVRKAVYSEMGYPRDGDAQAEREIKKRLAPGKAAPEPETVLEAVAALEE